VAFPHRGFSTTDSKLPCPPIPHLFRSIASCFYYHKNHGLHGELPMTSKIQLLGHGGFPTELTATSLAHWQVVHIPVPYKHKMCTHLFNPRVPSLKVHSKSVYPVSYRNVSLIRHRTSQPSLFYSRMQRHTSIFSTFTCTSTKYYWGHCPFRLDYPTPQVSHNTRSTVLLGPCGMFRPCHLLTRYSFQMSPQIWYSSCFQISYNKRSTVLLGPCGVFRPYHLLTRYCTDNPFPDFVLKPLSRPLIIQDQRCYLGLAACSDRVTFSQDTVLTTLSG